MDASVAVKWFLEDEDFTEQAVLLLDRFGRGEIELIAPPLIRSEVPAAITWATLGQHPRITRDQGEEALRDFLSIDLRIAGDVDLTLAAYSLTHETGCAFYDALYLALARQLDIPLITADSRCYRRIHHLHGVIWIGG